MAKGELLARLLFPTQYNRERAINDSADARRRFHVAAPIEHLEFDHGKVSIQEIAESNIVDAMRAYARSNHISEEEVEARVDQQTGELVIFHHSGR